MSMVCGLDLHRGQITFDAMEVETGEVWVDRIAAVHDVGRVINPLGAASQIEGGIIQGIGHTLHEGFTFTDAWIQG